MSREVLENYLPRSISMEGLLNGRGDLDDNIRMLKSTGAKFIGRSLCLWGQEGNLLRNLERAKEQIPKVLAADPAQHGGRRIVFLSGNDGSANAEVAALVERLGFAAIDLGKISEGGRLQQFGGPLVAIDLVQHGSPARRRH